MWTLPLAPPVGLEPTTLLVPKSIACCAGNTLKETRSPATAAGFARQNTRVLSGGYPVSTLPLIQEQKIKRTAAKAASFLLAPPVGLEPTTLRLTAACSTGRAKEECEQHPVKPDAALCRRLLIFPGRFQPSIFSASGLNCRVRDGNGCTPTAIGTDSYVALLPMKTLAEFPLCGVYAI